MITEAQLTSFVNAIAFSVFFLIITFHYLGATAQPVKPAANRAIPVY